MQFFDRSVTKEDKETTLQATKTLSTVTTPLEELKGLMGLKNSGKTSYMNSAPQCLSYTPELTQFFLNNDWFWQIKVETHSSDSSTEWLHKYDQLLRELWCGESKGFVDATSFQKELESKLFQGVSQNDPKEFLSSFIGILHEELRRGAKENFSLKNLDLATSCQKFNKRNVSFISQLISGQFNSQIEFEDINRCCDTFNMISVPLDTVNEKMSIYVLDRYNMFILKKLTFFVGLRFTLQQLKHLLIENQEIDQNYRFYLHGKKGREHLEMILVEEDYSKYHSKNLYDLDAFPFLIDDATLKSYRPSENRVITLFRVPFYHRCQHLTKPVILPKRMEVKRIYELVFEMVKASDQEVYKKDFSDYWSISQNWPFVLTYDKKPLFEMENGEIIVLEDYALITIHLKTGPLKETDNFGKKLAITSYGVKVGKTSLSIYDCFDSFMRNGIVNRDNTWCDSDCKNYRQASKEMKISKLPKILIVHLERFAKKKDGNSEIPIFVDFPLTGLDLQEYMMKGATSGKYDLYGVINHRKDIEEQHYFAYVNIPAQKDTWVCIDDEKVEIITSNEIVSEMAYVLFYRRVG